MGGGSRPCWALPCLLVACTAAAAAATQPYTAQQHAVLQPQLRNTVPAARGNPALGRLFGSQADEEPDKPKPLWPLDAIDIAVAGIILFSLSLAGGAGIGGGAILVPVFLQLRGWPTAIAVAMSNVTILGGSFANFVCNVNRHRPNGKRTIDWELITIMEERALGGAVLNKLLPSWITTYLLSVLLTLLGLRLYTKAKQAYAKETQLLAAAKAASRERHQHHHHSGSAPLATLRAASQQRKNAGNGTTGDASAHHDQTATPRAIPAGRSAGSKSSGSRGIISRSLSQLRGGRLMLGGDLQVTPHPPNPLGLAAAAAAAAAEDGDSSTPRAPAARSLLSGASFRRQPLATSLRRSSAIEAAATSAAAAVDVSSQAYRMGRYERNTLFQGDVIDDLEPIVVLPPSDDGSLDSASSGDSADLEAGIDESAATGDDLTQPLLKQSASGRGASLIAAAPAGPDADAPTGSSKPPEREPPLPIPHFATLLALSAWVVAADMGQDSFDCGSFGYWAAQLSVLLPVAVILLVFRSILLKKYRHDELPAGHELPEGEIHWTSKSTLLYPLICTTAGLMAGLFGIGGGVVKGPLMLEMAVPADVAAATSATMILFTSASACLVFVRFGHILYDYAAVLVVLGFFVTLCSQLLTFMLIKLLGRRSIIVFSMVALMAVATGIMYIQSAIVTRDIIQHPEDLWKFGRLCPSPGHNQLVQRVLAFLLPRAA